MRAWSVLGLVFGLGAAGCGDDDGPNNVPDAMAVTDTSMADTRPTPTDAPRDARPRDTGVMSDDPCFSESAAEARDLAGCNMGLLGPNRMANQFGGRCQTTGDMNSCTDEGAGCWGDPMGQNIGVCIIPCMPTEMGYTTTADCPSGSRCIPLQSGDAFCFPDCMGATDCAHGDCDVDGTCIGGGDPPVVPDGGMPEGGMMEGGVDDAGPADAGPAPDGAADDDAGPAPDAGMAVDTGTT